MTFPPSSPSGERGELLLALAARCEAASGPDRLIDIAIANAFYTRNDWQWTYCRSLTASLDDALALVAEKVAEPFWRVGNDQDNPGDTFRAELMAFDLPKPPVRTIGKAATPALALLAALCRALASH